jgi:hypothetical protein
MSEHSASLRTRPHNDKLSGVANRRRFCSSSCKIADGLSCPSAAQC